MYRTIALILLLASSLPAQQYGGKTGMGGKSGVAGGSNLGVGTPVFTHAQNDVHNSSLTGGAVTCTLGSTPDSTKAHVLIVAAFTSGDASSIAVKDANNNVYTLSPSAPSNLYGISSSVVWQFFLIMPSSGNATAAVTITPNYSVQFTACYLSDFTNTVRTAIFDIDAAGAAASAASPAILPSITVQNSGELLYSSGAGSSAGLTGVGGSWVQNTFGNDSTLGLNAAYILSSASGANAVNFTYTGTQNYDTFEMAFK